ALCRFDLGGAPLLPGGCRGERGHQRDGEQRHQKRSAALRGSATCFQDLFPPNVSRTQSRVIVPLRAWPDGMLSARRTPSGTLGSALTCPGTAALAAALPPLESGLVHALLRK